MKFFFFDFFCFFWGWKFQHFENNIISVEAAKGTIGMNFMFGGMGVNPTTGVAFPGTECF
jgi:hypothetical protein